jgi:hypothetical protein
MSQTNGCFSAPELAAHYQVPVPLMRNIIDRLEIGVTVTNGTRVVFAEHIGMIEIALKSQNKLRVSQLSQSDEIRIS